MSQLSTRGEKSMQTLSIGVNDHVSKIPTASILGEEVSLTTCMHVPHFFCL